MLSTCMAFWYTETKHVICFVILCLIRCPFHMHWYVHLVLIPSFLSASKQKQQKHKIHLPCSNWSEYSPNGSNVKIPLYCSIFGRDKRRLITGRPCIWGTQRWNLGYVRSWGGSGHRAIQEGLKKCMLLTLLTCQPLWSNIWWRPSSLLPQIGNFSDHDLACAFMARRRERERQLRWDKEFIQQRQQLLPPSPADKINQSVGVALERGFDPI